MTSLATQAPRAMVSPSVDPSPCPSGWNRRAHLIVGELGLCVRSIPSYPTRNCQPNTLRYPIERGASRRVEIAVRALKCVTNSFALARTLGACIARGLDLHVAVHHDDLAAAAFVSAVRSTCLSRITRSVRPLDFERDAWTWAAQPGGFNCGSTLPVATDRPGPSRESALDRPSESHTRQKKLDLPRATLETMKADLTCWKARILPLKNASVEVSVTGLQGGVALMQLTSVQSPHS